MEISNAQEVKPAQRVYNEHAQHIVKPDERAAVPQKQHIDIKFTTGTSTKAIILKTPSTKDIQVGDVTEWIQKIFEPHTL